MNSKTPSLPEPLDVIAVGAHPDDVEIGCGGTLARMAQQGFRVGIVDLTDGEPTPLSPGPEVRLQEAREAARILGIEVRETLTLPNRRLFDNFEARVELAKVFRRYRPRLVLGIADRTPMASPDHWQAMQITDAAVFYSRLSKWDDAFDGLPVHRIQRQIWYPLGLQMARNLPSGGQFVVTRIRRWHALGFVFGDDALIDFAGLGIAGNNRETPLAQILLGGGFLIQAHFGFAVAIIGTMTGKAAVGKNRPDVAIEFHRSS